MTFNIALLSGGTASGESAELTNGPAVPDGDDAAVEGGWSAFKERHRLSFGADLNLLFHWRRVGSRNGVFSGGSLDANRVTEFSSTAWTPGASLFASAYDIEARVHILPGALGFGEADFGAFAFVLDAPLLGLTDVLDLGVRLEVDRQSLTAEVQRFGGGTALAFYSLKSWNVGPVLYLDERRRSGNKKGFAKRGWLGVVAGNFRQDMQSTTTLLNETGSVPNVAVHEFIALDGFWPMLLGGQELSYRSTSFEAGLGLLQWLSFNVPLNSSVGRSRRFVNGPLAGTARAWLQQDLPFHLFLRCDAQFQALRLTIRPEDRDGPTENLQINDARLLVVGRLGGKF